jgi:hypothetical protein
MRDLPIEMKIGLRDYGIQEARLSKFTMRTRVMRDLRICGKRFENLYDCLARAYDTDKPAPYEHTASAMGNDCLFVALGGFIPFFDRFIETPEVTLLALDRYLRE